MKKNSLTMAVVAGIAGVAGFASLASAVEMNPDGLGQVLIYPYFTVNKGQDTLISVVNTDDVNGKIVKVRFLEGYNSREVLDFNLYLSPNDVWTASVSQVGDDLGAAIKTFDNSCTFPIFASGVPKAFLTYTFDGAIGPKDGAPTDVKRTREGYLEMIQMGDIPPNTDLFDTILHDSTGHPECDTSLTGNNVVSNPDVVAPTGTLFGSGAIVNVGQGTFFGYNADAIDGFFVAPFVTQANSTSPSLQSYDNFVSYIFNNGALLTLDYSAYTSGADAVSAVYQSDTLYNEYLTVPGIGAATDWVVTFPTKRFYVDPFYVGSAGPAIAPFVQVFNKVSNVEVILQQYDQEEQTIIPQDCDPLNPTPGSDCDWSPSPPVDVEPSSLPYEVNVISFLDGADPIAGVQSGVLGSKLVFNVPPFADAGWIRLDLASGNGGVHVMRAAANGMRLRGLPATGFEVYNIVNSNVSSGVMANYSGLFRHRASRSCDPAGTPCS